jgi:hypothetical protein
MYGTSTWLVAGDESGTVLLPYMERFDSGGVSEKSVKVPPLKQKYMYISSKNIVNNSVDYSRINY